MSKQKLVIIDGNSLVNRAFYALPPLTNSKGLHTNGIYGFLTMYYKILEEIKPTHMVVAFDMKAKTFRHQQYADYKAGRKGMPQELSEQMPILKEVLDALAVKRLEIEGYEADDIIGTLAKKAGGVQMETIVFTGDKDALQLVDDNVKVMITKKGITETETYTPQIMEEKYGITPTQFIDVKALMGDQSDNIPGVPGVGEKTALKLITAYSSVEGVYSNINEVKGDKLRENLLQNKDSAFMSKELATIIVDIPLDMDVQNYELKDGNFEQLSSLYNDLGFKSLIQKLPKENKDVASKEANYKIITIDSLQSFVDSIRNTNFSNISFKVLTSLEDNSKGVAIAFAYNEDQVYYYRFKNDNEDINAIKSMVEDIGIKKISHNAKDDFVYFKNHGISPKGIVHDAMIACYLLDPSKGDYSVDQIANRYLGLSLLTQEQLLGKGKSSIDFPAVKDEELESYLCDIVYTVLKSHSPIMDRIEEEDLLKLYSEVEIPLVEVLSDMEYHGFRVDREELVRLSSEFTQIIDSLTKDIYSLAQEEFNINSTKQLGYILFEKLGLPTMKKTKTGYSTDAEVLSELEDKHEIIGKILEYRQLVKLKSTYVDGLISVINPMTGKIHSRFNQTVTATGRISSTEPNLQNIPIKVEMGRKIRKVFIPSDENYTLLDGDYSQIELRVLAHISDDQNMINAFLTGEDIHTNTGARVFGVDKKEVTSLMRSRAKAVNFGIVYGISDFGLSRDLKITKKEAQSYIDSYFDKYHGVKNYMESIVEDGKSKGFVTTLLGRRRYLPELSSKNFNIKSFGERIAMNTPIQGSAADIIKIAMVRVYQKLKNEGFRSRLILQVHDELIIETYKEEVSEVKEVVKNIMEEAIELSVPLEVELKEGNSWYDTK